MVLAINLHRSGRYDTQNERESAASTARELASRDSAVESRLSSDARVKADRCNLSPVFDNISNPNDSLPAEHAMETV